MRFLLLLLCFSAFATEQLITHVQYTRVITVMEQVDGALEEIASDDFSDVDVTKQSQVHPLNLDKAPVAYLDPLSSAKAERTLSFPSLALSYHLFSRPPPAIT